MSKSVNKVILVGHIGGAPQLNYTASNGKAVTSFTLATNSQWKNTAGEKQESVEWHKINAWEKLAELICEYCKKGSRVYIEGRLQTRTYEDAQGGTHYVTEIVAQDVLFLDRKESVR